MAEEEEGIADDILHNWLVIDSQSIPKFIIIGILIIAIVAGFMFLQNNNNVSQVNITSTTSTTIYTTSTVSSPGAIDLTVLYGNVPANGAAVSIQGYFSGVTDPNGYVTTGFRLGQGTYRVYATYGGNESSINITVSEGSTSSATLIIPGPIINPPNTTTSILTTTIRNGTG